MVLKFNGTQVENVVYKGQQLDRLQLNGVTVWERVPDPYKPGDVLFESYTAGSYSLGVKMSGDYTITCIGAGAGNGLYIFHHHYGVDKKLYASVASGSAGGVFNSTLRLDAGTYVITVGGAGSSYIYNIYDTGNVFPANKAVGYAQGGDGGLSGIYKDGNTIVVSNGGKGGRAEVSGYNVVSYIPTFKSAAYEGGSVFVGTSEVAGKGGSGNVSSNYLLKAGTVTASANGGTNGTDYGWAGYCEVSTSDTATKNSYKWNGSKNGYVKIVKA